MFEFAINSELENIQYSADLSVVVQQIFSCLFGNPDGLKGRQTIKTIKLIIEKKK